MILNISEYYFLEGNQFSRGLWVGVLAHFLLTYIVELGAENWFSGLGLLSVLAAA